jgi:hypothetical protein
VCLNISLHGLHNGFAFILFKYAYDKGGMSTAPLVDKLKTSAERNIKMYQCSRSRGATWVLKTAIPFVVNVSSRTNGCPEALYRSQEPKDLSNASIIYSTCREIRRRSQSLREEPRNRCCPEPSTFHDVLRGCHFRRTIPRSIGLMTRAHGRKGRRFDGEKI